MCEIGSRGREKAVLECKSRTRASKRRGERDVGERDPDTPDLMGNFVFGEPGSGLRPLGDYHGGDYEK